MYDELKERCRACSQGCIYPSECSYFDKPPLRCMRQLLSEAADAIEELSREAEEYKAAYRKEHNKRIAENRYLYDELTKVIKEKLLMTPMRIEVPEPPKEG